MEKVCTAIVLQGGGALGSYECGVMKELFESRGPDFRPHVISGISIGAVNAAVLAGANNPTADLEKVWLKFGELPYFSEFFGSAYSFIPRDIEAFLLRFGNQGMYRLRQEYVFNPFLAPFITDSYCDIAPLEKTLNEVVDLKRLNNNSQVVVTAVDVASGEQAKFGNTVALGTGGTYTNAFGLSINHILASSSLPPGFPKTTMTYDGKSSYYWDGGIHSNTPLSEAINCLERCENGSRDVKREIIFVELFPMEGRVPRNMDEVSSRFFKMMFASKLKLDEKLFKQYSGFIDLVETIDVLLDKIRSNDGIRIALDQALSSTGKGTIEDIRRHPAAEKLMQHRRIDSFRFIPFEVPAGAGSGFDDPLDFSSESIRERIAAGRDKARRENIKEFRFLSKEQLHQMAKAA